MAGSDSQFELLINEAYHIFLPPLSPSLKLNSTPHFNEEISKQISHSVLSILSKYKELDLPNGPKWDQIVQMVSHFTNSMGKAELDKAQVSRDIASMSVHDLLIFYIRAQNCAVIIRKLPKGAIFEVFEVQASSEQVMRTSERLVRYYPGPAVELPNATAADPDFCDEIANFLVRMDVDRLERGSNSTCKVYNPPLRASVRSRRSSRSSPRAMEGTRENSPVSDDSEAEHASLPQSELLDRTEDDRDPSYFVQLFLGILRGMGEVANPPRVVKRIADEVLYNDTTPSWRRSPVWLIIRVALHTSLSSTVYKQFMAFFHAEVLSRCAKHDAFPSDMLYAMRVKLGKRVFKLKGSLPPFAMQNAEVTVDEVQTVLERRWLEVQDSQSSLPELEPFDLDSDVETATHLTLPYSGEYLKEIFCGSHHPELNSPSFQPDQKAKLGPVEDFSRYINDTLRNAFSQEGRTALFDFELSVIEHLTTWTNANSTNALEACKVLGSCFEQYIDLAQSCYTDNPLDQSTMVLTLMLIWMAIDRLTTGECPLLLDFLTELPTDILDTLLLRANKHLEAARAIQSHLQNRYNRAVPTGCSIFSIQPSHKSFAVRYFGQSPELKALKEEIELHAHRKRDEVIAAFWLDFELHGGAPSSSSDVSRPLENNRFKSFRRVRDTNLLKQHMKTNRHVWPLPLDQPQAEALVFELRQPEIFVIWRDITYSILCDLAFSDGENNSSDPYGRKFVFEQLTPWLNSTEGTSARLVIMSTEDIGEGCVVRPSAESPTVHLSIDWENFRLYDTRKRCWARESYPKASFTRYGTFSLPSKSVYKHLQYAVSSTRYRHNHVLSDQLNCPETLTIQEHIAFGTLRCGPRLQWMNILRGLEENILTYSSQEVYLLHAQSAWQIGPLEDEHHGWHEDLRNPEYGGRLISRSRLLLERVGTNWLEITSVATVVMLVTRLLASACEPEVCRDAYQFLGEARQQIFGWLSELQDKVWASADGPTIAGGQHRICELAAVCRSTFDVDPVHFPKLLKAKGSLYFLIKSTGMLHENKPAPSDINSLPKYVQTLLRFDQRLSHKLIPHLLQQIRLDKCVLCGPIRDIWPNYTSHPDGWVELPTAGTHWVTTSAERSETGTSQQVYLDLSEGRLFVDGRPLGKLPQYYIEHPTYTRVFGKAVLEVVTADADTNMEFETLDHVHGHRVLFRMDHGQLVIKALKSGQVLQLLPFDSLIHDLPQYLLDNYHHWARLEDRTIEFRPTSQSWWSGKPDWILRMPTFTGNANEMVLVNTRNGHLSVDMHSSLFRWVSGIIGPLESPENILMTRQYPGRQIQVELPRMQLTFSLNHEGEIESTDFRDWIIDQNQSLGTLYGLRNRLVLCSKNPASRLLPRSRSVLIPFGDIDVTRVDSHVSVSVRVPPDPCVKFYRYLVDTDLGYLACDGNLTSRLYKIYLHAITSSCMPDPLTGRTGTEEALCALREASTSSFHRIDLEQGRLLQLIGGLTPDRQYRVTHFNDSLECAQETHWMREDISSLSRHFGFSTAAAEVLDRVNKLQQFYPMNFHFHGFYNNRQDTLLQRAAIRSYFYYPPETPRFLEIRFDQSKLGSKPNMGRDDLAASGSQSENTAASIVSLALSNWEGDVHRSFKILRFLRSDSGLPCSRGGTMTYDSTWLSLNLRVSWITLYDLCRRARNESNKYGFAICLASLAFGHNSTRSPFRKEIVALVQVLVAFATNHRFSTLDPPPDPVFYLGDGYSPKGKRVKGLLAPRELEDTPAAQLPRQKDETSSQYQMRQQDHYEQETNRCGLEFAKHLMGQWQSTKFQPIPEGYSPWFSIGASVEAVHGYFVSCARNKHLQSHIQQVEQALTSRFRLHYDRWSVGNRATSFCTLSLNVTGRPQQGYWEGFSVEKLTSRRLRPETTDAGEASILTHIDLPQQSRLPMDNVLLATLISEFQRSSNPVNEEYGRGLERSLRALAENLTTIQPGYLPPQAVLDSYRKSCQSAVQSKYALLKRSLAPKCPAERILFTCGIWPRVTPWTLLKQLTLRVRTTYHPSNKWQSEFIAYAQLFVAYQLSQRLVSLASSRKIREFWQELEPGSIAEGSHPDWLLAQIQGDFRVRPLQRKAAKEMMMPSTRTNAAFQLNMGEGKSSVIVPIIAASLANTKQLVRVIVPKSLWNQTFHTLVKRLAGLVDRRIYYLPVSRQINLDDTGISQLREHYEECLREGGILVTQPEHVLSLRLMGIDRLISGKSQAGKAFQNLHEWLNSHARDILDESDEILHTRFKLVYTIGEQKLVDNHPDRWITTQQLLLSFERHISQLATSFPESFACRSSSGSPGCYPYIRIMPDWELEAKHSLLSGVVDDVVNGKIQSLACSHLPKDLHDTLARFLVSKELQPGDAGRLKVSFNDSVWRGLLLARGLLALGVMEFALKEKRYRVDYGLDTKRSELAVPFSAKDIPSPSSEFGHPDVTIVLTCLSYYYKGLTRNQLEQCFELLYRLDNPSLEYKQWLRFGSLPPDFPNLGSINTKDQDHFGKKIFPALSGNVMVINYYLCSVVFPRAAKEYKEKLSASGWDLAELRSHVATGFSGTNDHQDLLPLSITQVDPLNQLSTNALGLTYLLRPENNHYICMCDDSGTSVSNQDFLKTLVAQRPMIQVLIDVGAQMLELGSQDLVRYWLGLLHGSHIQAAVFINDDDDIMVLPRSGQPSLLRTSPFCHQLENCIVYLDDGHTRGTDLKLPNYTRGLVTLGPKVTKDRLLQGCMRLRKLGHGQSVIFAAPAEVDRQIRQAASEAGTPVVNVKSLDVLRWAMLTTCEDIRRYTPAWAQQGIDHAQRTEAWGCFHCTSEVSALREAWLTPEARTLEEMYQTPSSHVSAQAKKNLVSLSRSPELQRRIERLGIQDLTQSNMDEEQEREVSQEVERATERNPQPWLRPSDHFLHQDVREFVITGKIPAQSSAFSPLFIHLSSLNPRIADQWPRNLLASKDFLYPLEDPLANRIGPYMRPVHWVMIGQEEARVVLSPYEVNELLPAIRQSTTIRLHAYAPRVNETMRPLSNLDLYSIPPQPTRSALVLRSITQIYLDLFAGQLYFQDYDEYAMLCALLGLRTPRTSLHVKMSLTADPDGFIKPRNREELVFNHPEYALCRFTESPIPTLKALLENRRGGMTYALTPVGQVLHGQTLTESNFITGSYFSSSGFGYMGIHRLNPNQGFS